MRIRAGVISAVLPLAAIVLASGCSSSSAVGGSGAPGDAGTIAAVGAENEYADVIGQVGGTYVHAEAIVSNPGTDPHTFEASPSVAREIGQARLIVQNGAGYDDWITSLEKAVPGSGRQVIDVQHLLGLPGSTPNPHLWYKPSTMPAVASAVAVGLAAIEPAHAAYFKANAARFTASLAPLNQALARFRAKYPGTPVATTEPVADYLLQAAGTVNMTPWAFQADVMNGTDPSAQDVAVQRSLFTGRKVKVFLYNQQVTDSLTESYINLAHASGIPVVGVYETMPTPGYHYQSWMLAEVHAMDKALAGKTSTEHL
jgi:zinc/manganese transport system substrate-binding protein